MTRNRKLVLLATTLLAISAVVIPEERMAGAWAIVQCAQLVQRVLPVGILITSTGLHMSAVPLTRQQQEVV